MAAADVDLWIPEEEGGPVLQKINASSVVEVIARQEPMSTLTKKVPRDGGVDFDGATTKGVAISEDDGDVDTVLLTARKLAKIVRLNDEDVEDTSDVANVVTQKQLGWARAYGIGFDNATLAVTAAENGTTIPFTSLYKTLMTTDAGLPDGVTYTGGSNVVQTATGAGVVVSYDNLSNVFGLLESGNFWSDAEMGSSHIQCSANFSEASRTATAIPCSSRIAVWPQEAGTCCSAQRSSGVWVRAPQRSARTSRTATLCSSSATPSS